jgi:uncharacterized protein (TIGR03435 family)
LTLPQKPYSYLAASTALFLTGLAYAQLPSARPEFEVASVKPDNSNGRVILIPPVGGRFTATNVSLKMLIGLAYNVRNFQLTGGPVWIDSARFDVDARAVNSNIAQDQFPQMLQGLLEDRFQLTVHRETREMPVYTLLPAKSGLKLPDAKPNSCSTFALVSARGQARLDRCDGLMVTPNRIENRKISMAWFASTLSNLLSRPVVDKTGFTGTFSVHLDFANDTGDVDSSRPSIFTALQEQLGLRLESQKGPGEMLVIDHAGRPAEN